MTIDPSSAPLPTSAASASHASAPTTSAPKTTAPKTTAPTAVAERWAHLIQQASLCGRHLRRLLAQHIARWNLSDTEFLVLWACHNAVDAGLAQNEIATMLGVSPAQMSGLVYDLRDRGLLSFERTERDRRRQVLLITGAGRLLLSKILVDLEPLTLQLARKFPESEQLQAEQMFDRLAAAAALPDPPTAARETPAPRTFDPSQPVRRAS